MAGDCTDRDTACRRSHIYRCNCGRENSTYSKRGRFGLVGLLNSGILVFFAAKWNDDRLKHVPDTINGNDSLFGLLCTTATVFAIFFPLLAADLEYTLQLDVVAPDLPLVRCPPLFPL